MTGADFTVSGVTSILARISWFLAFGWCICGPMLRTLSQKKQCIWKSNTKKLQRRRSGDCAKDAATWERWCALDRDLQRADWRRRPARTDISVDQGGRGIAASAFRSRRVAA